MEEKDLSRETAVEQMYGPGTRYEQLSAWGQMHVDRVLSQFEHPKVDTPYTAALPNRETTLIQDNERLARANEQLVKENLELWQENEELNLRLAELVEGS